MQFISFIVVLFSLLYITTEKEVHLDVLKLANSNVTDLPEKNLHNGSSAFVSCTCHGQILKEEFPMEVLKPDHEDIAFFEYCAKNNTEVCELSRKCDNCTLELKNCSRLSKTENVSSECFYRSIKVKEGRHSLKTKITGPARHLRDLYLKPGCIFPNEMRTSELKCHVFSKYIKCRQRCMYGYTLQEGISRQMTCYYKDKKWSGGGFTECHPFVDCNMKLTSGGQMSCEKNTMDKAPHCNVSCEPYEDKSATPMRTYTCTLERNKWNPDLPHCVIPGSGLILVSEPRIKDHSKEVFEDETKYKKPRPSKIPKPDVADDS